MKDHSCPNDCIVYIRRYENHHKCPICGASIYKRKDARAGEDDGDEVKKGQPTKTVWYLTSVSGETLATDVTYISGNQAAAGEAPATDGLLRP